MEYKYFLPPLRRLPSAFFMIICVFVLCITVFRISDVANSTTFQRHFVFPLTIFVFLIEAIRFAFEFFQVIVINPIEITYRASGYTVSVHWKDVTRIGQRSILKYDCLFVDKSTEGVKIWLPGTLWGEAEAFIPLSHFEKNWRDSELGQQIKQYAPHLFQGAEDVPSR